MDLIQDLAQGHHLANQAQVVAMMKKRKQQSQRNLVERIVKLKNQKKRKLQRDLIQVIQILEKLNFLFKESDMILLKVA